MNETLKLGLILLSITAVCATILAFSNEITSVKIEEASIEANKEARIEVLSDAEEFELLDETKMEEIKEEYPSILEIYEGYNGEDIVGYTVKVKVKAYGGDMEFMSGVSTGGNIEGITILNHGETPGLGANAEKEYFTDSFENKTVEEPIYAAADPEGDSEVQALTSATITTDAIVDGVNIIREVYNLSLSN